MDYHDANGLMRAMSMHQWNLMSVTRSSHNLFRFRHIDPVAEFPDVEHGEKRMWCGNFSCHEGFL